MLDQRLLSLISALNLNINQFAKEIGYDRPDKIYKLTKGENKPSYETLHTIGTVYPQVSMDWLIMGVGPMFRGQADQESVTMNPGGEDREKVKALLELVRTKDQLIEEKDKLLKAYAKLELLIRAS
jgi:hypothetical protein